MATNTLAKTWPAQCSLLGRVIFTQARWNSLLGVERNGLGGKGGWMGGWVVIRRSEVFRSCLGLGFPLDGVDVWITYPLPELALRFQVFLNEADLILCASISG